MGKLSLGLIVIFLLTACGAGNAAPASSSASAKPGAVKVEIAYLNHPPVRPVLTEVNTLLDKYGDQVSVTRYDFDSTDGAAFAKTKGLMEHTPIAIYINGSMDFKNNNRAVKFYSFPQNQGTGIVADGNWTMDDLQAALDQATGKHTP
jgi:hypothetical protein